MKDVYWWYEVIHDKVWCSPIQMDAQLSVLPIFEMLHQLIYWHHLIVWWRILWNMQSGKWLCGNIVVACQLLFVWSRRYDVSHKMHEMQLRFWHLLHDGECNHVWNILLFITMYESRNREYDLFEWHHVKWCGHDRETLGRGSSLLIHSR